VVAVTPAGHHVDGDGAEAIARWNEEAGIEIDAQTGVPGWDGERIDYAWAVDGVLRVRLRTPVAIKRPAALPSR
jgi:hypothetical protein